MSFERLKGRIVDAWLKTDHGRRTLAAAMISPLIPNRRDYGPPCISCRKSFVYDGGRVQEAGGADDGCAECVVRMVQES